MIHTLLLGGLLEGRTGGGKDCWTHRMDGWMDGWMDGQTAGWMDRQTNRQTYGRTAELLQDWTDGLLDGLLDVRTTGWMDG